MVPPSAHNRRKSYADMVVDSKSKPKIEALPVREERETLCKPKYPKDNLFLQQMTPKNSQNIARS